MDDSDLLAFTPVPLRARRDGWTPKKQYFFILGLARGFTPAHAAGILGLTRKTAYELRRKPGGEGFAVAWDAAVERARTRRIEAQAVSLIQRGLHGEWVPRLSRGRLTGWTHKVTSAGLMRVLNRLDKMANRLPPDAEAIDFEQLLDTIAPKRDSSNTISPTEHQFCNVPPPDQPRSGSPPETSPFAPEIRGPASH